MASSETEPLLRSGPQGGSEADGHLDDGAHEGQTQWAQWAQFVVPPAGQGPVDVSIPEIRQAAAQDPYPQWIYGALVTPENESSVITATDHVDLLKLTPREESRQLPPGCNDYCKSEGILRPLIAQSTQTCVRGFEEEEIRALLCDHVDHRCCWGGRPAYKWPMKKLEDCNTFIGTLETFYEEREVEELVEPHDGGAYDSLDHGHPPGPWEVDMRDEFPLLFTTEKEARMKLPFSQRVERCGDCSGSGEVFCPWCHMNEEPGIFRPGKTTSCSICYGRGLIAHQDGSDTHCSHCQGRGNLRCAQCNSRGTITCGKCGGSGALLYSKILVVRWKTQVNKIVSASSYAASVPDDVFHEAKGVQLYSDQAWQCKPVQFPSSFGLSKLSSDLFESRKPLSPGARVICERHQLHMVPVSRAVMADGDRSFQFYIVGLEKRIYLKNYPSTCSLCCCVQVCSIM